MRILHLHDSPHIRGGASAYLRQLVPEMAARGCTAALYSLDQAALDLSPDAQAYVYPGSPSALRRRYAFHHRHAPLARSLGAAIQHFAPVLVHVQNWSVFRSTVFPTLYAAKLPVLMTVHDFSLLDPNPWGLDRSGPAGPLQRLLDRESLGRARRAVFKAVQRFLCPTEALLRDIPFPAGRARLLRMPVAPVEFVPAPPPPLRLLFAGTLYRSKGVDLLLAALAQAPEWILEIAGTGDQEPALRAQSAALGVSARTRFLGQCSPAAMQEAYRRAHLVVLPSRVPENSPLTVLEAGAGGRPALASGSGGVPELLDQERGWTFPAGDQAALAKLLQELAQRPGELERRGLRMRAWVQEHCDPRRHFDQVAAVYRELAE